jgi:serine phosphatase RsbU (regulator of sigma subunit)/ketosteroid isomerase-like protein
MSSEDNNKELARRFLEAFANGDLDTLDELLAPDFVNHSLLPGQAPGREGYIQMAAEKYAAYSDIRHNIEYQATDGEDMVITRHTTRRIHDRGASLGIEPTGREWTFTHIDMHRISGGRVVEEWSAKSASPFLEMLDQERRERERVEQELRVARRIQQASLPKGVPQLEDWQIAPFYQPAREVGGDFYDFLELADGRLGVVVGDATGKGVPAALMMASTRSTLRAVAQASESPGDALRRVNDPLATDIPSNMFVTCFYAILDPKSGSLRYANAGHNLPYLQRNGEAKELRARGMPLGLMPAMSYEEGEDSLGEGGCILFYSDGLVEAHDPKGKMFGTPRLRDLLSEHQMGGTDLCATLMEELRRFTGEGWEQEDDITLLALERSASLR